MVRLVRVWYDIFNRSVSQNYYEKYERRIIEFAKQVHPPRFAKDAQKKVPSIFKIFRPFLIFFFFKSVYYYKIIFNTNFLRHHFRFFHEIFLTQNFYIFNIKFINKSFEFVTRNCLAPNFRFFHPDFFGHNFCILLP